MADWVDPTVKGNGKGFPRLVEPPAVKPRSNNPKNNVNVISLAYAGSNGINIHYQTPFGLGTSPTVRWGSRPWQLSNTATGVTDTYDRTPPCSLVDVTLCSQYFHNVQLKKRCELISRAISISVGICSSSWLDGQREIDIRGRWSGIIARAAYCGVLK